MGNLVMPNDLDRGEAAVEVEDVLLHRLQLEGRAGVLWSLTVRSAAADIDDMAGEGVVPCGTVGDFPGIYLGVLIVCDESLHTAVEVDHIGVSDLLPAASPLGGRGGVPAADLTAGDSAPLGGGGAVKDEVLQLCHRLGVSRDDSCQTLLRAQWGANCPLAHVEEMAVVQRVILGIALVGDQRAHSTHTAPCVEGYGRLSRPCSSYGTEGELRLRGHGVGRSLGVLIDVEAEEATDTAISSIEVVLTDELLTHREEVLDVVRTEDQDTLTLRDAEGVKGLLQEEQVIQGELLSSPFGSSSPTGQ